MVRAPPASASPVPNSRCLLRARLITRESPFVDLLGDEATDVGVQAPGLGDEDPCVLGIVRCSPSTCWRTLAPDPPGCSALATWLNCRGSPSKIMLRAPFVDGHRVGERQLPGLVDDQDVNRVLAHALVRPTATPCHR